jgi:hypothetical protein
MPDRPTRRPRRFADRGQSVVEFALVVPFLLLMVIAIADVGRVYNAAVAIESAAREAADHGSFDADYWLPANVADTVASMERRACTAAKGSHLADYAGATDGTTCTNPLFVCTLEWGAASTPCASYGGSVGGKDCTNVVDKAEDTCTVHVRLEYEFRAILGLAPFGLSFDIGRDSRYRVADLTAPTP